MIKPPATWPQHLARVVVMTPVAGAGPLKCVKVAFLGQDCSWAQTTPGILPPLQPIGTLKAQVLSWEASLDSSRPTLDIIVPFMDGECCLALLPHCISAAKSHSGFLEIAVSLGIAQRHRETGGPCYSWGFTSLCVCFPPAGPVAKMFFQAPIPHLGPLVERLSPGSPF